MDTSVCINLYVCVCDLIIGQSQESDAANKGFSCSPMRTTCSTSKLWMRPERANRARLLSFPQKVKKKKTPKLSLWLFLCYCYLFSYLLLFSGTRFQLLKASAHPALELSVDETTLHYSQDTHLNTVFTDREWVSSHPVRKPFRDMYQREFVCLSRCPSILGELFPARGRYYWETIVSQSSAYRLGVQYSTADRNSSLGENRWSWCLQCIPTPSGYA